MLIPRAFLGKLLRRLEVPDQPRLIGVLNQIGLAGVAVAYKDLLCRDEFSTRADFLCCRFNPRSHIRIDLLAKKVSFECGVDARADVAGGLGLLILDALDL